MQVSIITATFNSASTIRDTLHSIHAQTYPSIEHIIIDGKSEDETLQIVRQFPHVSKIVSEKDEGIYDAMNKGIDQAEGEVIGILNSDDMYASENVISNIAAVFEDEEADICYADLEYVDQVNTGKVVRRWKSGGFNANSFHYGWMPPHPTLFLRKHVYDKVGKFNIKLKNSADYELMLRIFLKNKFHVRYLPEVIVKMRTGGISNASFHNRITANKEDREAWKINGLRPRFFTLYLKPIRKITQFLKK